MYRYCIYPKEISIIIGKSYTHSCQLVRTIKDAYGKSSHQPVTIKEFCDHMDLPFDDIFNMINRINSKLA